MEPRLRTSGGRVTRRTRARLRGLTSWTPPLLACGLLLVCLPSHGGSEAETLRFEGDPRVLESVPSEVYSPRELKGDQASEVWNYLFQFKNGYVLSSQFTVTNVGPGDRSALALGLIIAPDGTVAALRNSRKRKEWTFESTPDSLQMNVARHELAIRPPVHRIVMKHGDGSFEVEATALTPAFQPGRLPLSKDKYYELTVLAPRMSARGRAQITGRPSVELDGGSGIAFHWHSNQADHKQAVSWMRFDTFDRDTQISLLEFTAPKSGDYKRMALLLLFRNNKLVHHSYGYTRRYDSYQKDQEKPHYPVPESFTFSSDGDGGRVRGTVRLQPVYRLDILQWVNSGLVRFFIKQTSNPIDYRFRGEYELEVDLGKGPETLKGSGLASVSILNDPPDDY